MARQPLNDQFLRTAFLGGANAAYVEEMQSQYERNPGSVSDEWRHFFASLQEEQSGRNGAEGHNGPSWAKPLEQIEQDYEGQVYLAVTVDEDGSGKSRTRAPLASWYSVMPSTVVIFLGAWAGAALASRAAASRARQDWVGKRQEAGGFIFGTPVGR